MESLEWVKKLIENWAKSRGLAPLKDVELDILPKRLPPDYEVFKEGRNIVVIRIVKGPLTREKVKDEILKTLGEVTDFADKVYVAIQSAYSSVCDPKTFKDSKVGLLLVSQKSVEEKIFAKPLRVYYLHEIVRSTSAEKVVEGAVKEIRKDVISLLEKFVNAFVLAVAKAGTASTQPQVTVTPEASRAVSTAPVVSSITTAEVKAEVTESKAESATRAATGTTHEESSSREEKSGGEEFTPPPPPPSGEKRESLEEALRKYKSFDEFWENYILRNPWLSVFSSKTRGGAGGRKRTS